MNNLLKFYYLFSGESVCTPEFALCVFHLFPNLNNIYLANIFDQMDIHGYLADISDLRYKSGTHSREKLCSKCLEVTSNYSEKLMNF